MLKLTSLYSWRLAYLKVSPTTLVNHVNMEGSVVLLPGIDILKKELEKKHRKGSEGAHLLGVERRYVLHCDTEQVKSLKAVIG